MTGAASQAGEADSSRAPGLTSGLQGSVLSYFTLTLYHVEKIRIVHSKAVTINITNTSNMFNLSFYPFDRNLYVQKISGTTS